MASEVPLAGDGPKCVRSRDVQLAIARALDGKWANLDRRDDGWMEVGRALFRAIGAEGLTDSYVSEAKARGARKHPGQRGTSAGVVVADTSLEMQAAFVCVVESLRTARAVWAECTKPAGPTVHPDAFAAGEYEVRVVETGERVAVHDLPLSVAAARLVGGRLDFDELARWARGLLVAPEESIARLDRSLAELLD